MYTISESPNQNQFEAALKTSEAQLSGESNIELGLNFDPWSLSTAQLCGTALSLFKELGLVEFMNTTEMDLLQFISDVERGYFANPYHSFHHAVDVSVIVYHFLVQFGANTYLEQDDILALMLASLCHDIGHPGTNNVYQINAKTPLAQKYHENSILETHSCHLTQQLLNKHQLLDKTPNKEFLCNRIEELILFTDMKFHFQLLEDMKRIICDERLMVSSDSSSPSPPTLDPSQILVDEPQPVSSVYMDTPEFRLKVSNAIIHAADISNPARPWNLCKTWSDLVVQEFYHQGDLEKQAHLPISLNMDRECHAQHQIALDFDEYLVQPFFYTLSQFLPQCYELVVNLQKNKMHWIQLKTSAQPPEASTAPPHHTTDPQFARRVSFSPGTVDIPLSFGDDVRRHSSDGSRFAYRHTRKTRTWARQHSGRKRENCSPDRMNVFNSLLKHTLTKVSSTESLSSQYEHSTPVS